MSGIRVGLIVNPIAGMGGSVGLKGTDGVLVDRARALGAKPVAAARATAALSSLRDLAGVRILTCPAEMGETSARCAGFVPELIVLAGAGATSAASTRAAARELARERVDLLLFAGGDGTARDILPELGAATPLLGIPAGVKMHSAVFAATARTAGDVARLFLESRNRSRLLRDAEVMDREHDIPGSEAGSPRLYGLARTPHVAFAVPHAKSTSATTDGALLESALRRIAGLASDNRVTLIGPGSTMQRLKSMLGIEGSPLGVAAVQAGRCLEADASEARILELIEGRPARIVVSVVGGQGFLFGRGNQQLGARVLRQAGLENILVVASLEKLATCEALLVDTGDESLDDAFAGFIHVIVGEGRTVVFPVRNPRRALAALRESAPTRDDG